MDSLSQDILNQINQVISKIQEIDLSSILPLIAAIIEASIDENIAVGGRWSGSNNETDLFDGGSSAWVARSDKTIERYKNDKKDTRGETRPLYRSGNMRRLTEARPQGKSKIVITSRAGYAAIHQYGGYAGRGLKTYIPARPWITIGADELERIHDLIASII